MALYRIADFNPNYRQEAFDGDDVKGINVYADGTEEKIGNIDDVLVDDSGRFRYFILDTGLWGVGKKVLLPVAQSRVDVNGQKVYARGLRNKQQAERLPNYDRNMTVDYDYEEQVRDVYRMPTVGNSAPVERSVPVEAAGIVGYTQRSHAPSGETYSYDGEPEFYEMNDRDHQKFRLYEERLVAHKTRRHTADVNIGKHVETQQVSASIPVEKERVVIERTTPHNQGIATHGEADFREGKVAEIDVYEETANIQKQPFVREEVNIRKEIDQDTVETRETLRREELDVNTDSSAGVRYAEERHNRR